ncbi:40072_t:CDS:1, partial [Gigaspora margarita]
ELLSPYLQKKALNFLEKGIYKQNSDAIYLIQKIKELETKNNNLTKELEKLKKEIHSLKMKEVKANQAKALNTSKIRSAIQKAKKITPQNFQKSATKFFKLNKKEYSGKFMQLATEISNINGNSINSSIACTKKFYEFITNDNSKKWISASTLSRWNKEIAILHLNENQPQSWNCPNYGYGLTADESKRGDKKILVTGISFWNIQKDKPMLSILGIENLIHCNSDTVSSNVAKICNQNDINTKQCHFWLTDNTAYMSSEKNGAVKKFNTLSQTKAIHIP